MLTRDNTHYLLFPKTRLGSRFRLLSSVLFTLTVWLTVSSATAQEPLLVNPEARVQANLNTTITMVDFTQSANDGAISLVYFEGQPPKVQLIESQGKVSVTLSNTQLGKDQLVELNVADFGTVVSTIETFQEERDTRIEINYAGTVVVNKTVDGNILRIAIKPMDTS